MGNHCECDCPAQENAEENKGIGLIVISKEERVEGQKVGLLENIQQVEDGLKGIKISQQFKRLIEKEEGELFHGDVIWYTSEPRKMYIWRNDKPESERERTCLLQKCKLLVLTLNEQSEEAEGFYYGMVKDNLADDEHGMYVNSEGSVYKGGFQFSQALGKGSYTNPKQEYEYEGEWKNNLPHGQGHEKTRDGSYKGNFYLGKREGQGFFSGRQITFQGQWKQGLMNQGELVSNGGKYKGKFQNGMKSGWGLWEAKGESYEGQWKKGMKQGKGTYRFQNGSTYEGSFQNDLPHGEGKVTASGQIFEGLWREGKNIFYRTIHDLQ